MTEAEFIERLREWRRRRAELDAELVELVDKFIMETPSGQRRDLWLRLSGRPMEPVPP